MSVLVIGGGPIGLAAAIEARLAGFSVTVVEPRYLEPGGIDKACGEGLMPGALPLLERLGVHPEGMPLRGVSYRSASRHVDHLFENGDGLGVRRTTLQTALAERAAELGVVTMPGRAHRIEQDDSGVSVTLAAPSGITPDVLRADWVLGCDGLHSVVRREIGLNTAINRTSRARRRFGFRQHFAVAPWSELIEVHWTPSVEAYVTPVSPTVTGIALLGPPGTDFLAEIAKVPELAIRLLGAAPASALRGAGPFHTRARKPSEGRVLLVGDASGYVDAITGEGLRLGFEQARVAVANVTAGTPRGYDSDWRRVTRDFRALTNGLVSVANGPLRSAIVPLAQRLPRVYGSVVERLAR
ncbi:FAD-dependent monooxygenase [Glaciihabitans arcticus]|uniref:FAD-dependent monooxygenase n=1 Tax=Glaciihabitans arcticus TaxID=2668039 RepID=A0A4Q9GVB3_9MICO|nr:NAD(P)/FAD-dependent oxidoreductase [Glaciihabitans arcticus]TBN58174.1 FAD-dependent monooxygenase [Glaciihabitans arcticus]